MKQALATGALAAAQPSVPEADIEKNARGVAANRP